MAEDESNPNPNPPFRIGAPQSGSTLGELMEYHSQNGGALWLLIESGWFYGHQAPGDRENSR